MKTTPPQLPSSHRPLDQTQPIPVTAPQLDHAMKEVRNARVEQLIGTTNLYHDMSDKLRLGLITLIICQLGATVILGLLTL